MVVRKNDDPECYQTVDNVSKESNSALVNTKTSSFNLLDKKNSQHTNSSVVGITFNRFFGQTNCFSVSRQCKQTLDF